MVDLPVPMDPETEDEWGQTLNDWLTTEHNPDGTHSLAVADIGGLPGELDGKADVEHTHTMADVTDLPEFGTAATADTGDFASAADIADFETAAELNARDTANRDRANHTGTQGMGTIDGLGDALDALDAKGVAAGGTEGQVLSKASATDYDTAWIDVEGGGTALAIVSDDEPPDPETGTIWLDTDATGDTGLAWGDIGGTLSDQTDLQSALNAKANTAMLADSGMGFVAHGSNASEPRKTGYASILWLGSVEPTNMANGDMWFITD